MTMKAFECPAYLICGECGHSLQVVNRTLARGRVAYECPNSICPQYNQPHWHYFRELILTDEAKDEPVR